MQVNVVLKDWHLVQVEDGRKIAGTYNVKAGPVDVACQQFNEGYNASKVLFSSDLMSRIEKLTSEIETELTQTFTGGK
jgi:hypothetical protein